MENNKIQIALLIRKPIGEACLNHFLTKYDSDYISFVVTDFDDTGWWGETRTSAICKEVGVTCFNGSTITELQPLLSEFPTTHLVSVQYDKKVPQSVIEHLGGNAFNLHLAPLPEYQGWHSASHAILNHDEEFGATAHFMTDQLDFGPIVSRPTFELSPTENVGQVYYKSELAGLEAFSELLNFIFENAPISKATEMLKSKAKYYGFSDLQCRLAEANEELVAKSSDFSYRLSRKLGNS